LLPGEWFVKEVSMRKVIVEAEVSVDGAMGGENAAFWQQVFPFHSADVLEYLTDVRPISDHR